MDNPFEQINARLDKIESILQELLKNSKPTPIKAQRVPIYIDELSKLIKLAKPTIYALVNQRKIPSYKKGKKLFFFEDEILAWLEFGRNMTEEEIEKAADEAIAFDNLPKDEQEKINRKVDERISAHYAYKKLTKLEKDKVRREKLDHRYVANALRQQSGRVLQSNDIPNELIEIKRNALKIKRKIKNQII